MNTNLITNLALKAIGGPTAQDLRVTAKGAEQAWAVAARIVRKIVAETLQQTGANVSEVESIWRARAAVAEAGQWLCNTMQLWWSLEGKVAQTGNVRACVFELLHAHMANYGNAKATAATGNENPRSMIGMDELAQEVIRHQHTASGEQAGVVELARSVRATLSHAGFLVCRASAALWQAAEKKGTVKSIEKAGTKPKTATQAECDAYVELVRRFADELRRLNLDPTSLPVGSSAPAEAEAVRFARDFLVRRYREFRRWIQPETCMSPLWSTYAEQDAERGEDLILYFYAGDNAPLHPNPWTRRGGDTDPSVIGDMLCALMHAADALEIDFDAALGSAQNHYEDQVEMARTGIS